MERKREFLPFSWASHFDILLRRQFWSRFAWVCLFLRTVRFLADRFAPDTECCSDDEPFWILKTSNLKFKFPKILYKHHFQFFAVSIRHQKRLKTEQLSGQFSRLFLFGLIYGCTLSLTDSRSQGEWPNQRRVNRYHGKWVTCLFYQFQKI